MDRSSSPASQQSESVAASSPLSDEPRSDKRKFSRKKRLPTSMKAREEDGEGKFKKSKLKKNKDKDLDGRLHKKARKQQRVKLAPVEGGLTAAQMAVNEQMRRALEEDQYSANGSIVDTDSDDDELQYMYKGQSIRLDRAYLIQAARKHLWLERNAAGVAGNTISATAKENPEGDDNDGRPARGTKKKKLKGKRGKDEERALSPKPGDSETATGATVPASSGDAELERDEGSIFGQTTGSSNSTWVECDKCKKWRRLRGVVDERKLPPKWFCSMNKNDPERARCSAPEEEYDASTTPESAADARTRKHLRVWVRRLQCNEAYEARQPTLTRGKKRAINTSAKDPYEWIRCCNPSCGKWRVILRSMDAKSNVIDRATDGEWYCVMNTWDEKTASCAAPQENLPAVGCPPWVIQGEN